MDLESIVSKIMEEKSLGREEVEKLIQEKQAELSYLVSPEGAAYLVAKEMGIDIPDMGSKRLFIKNIISGMRNVQFVGKIVRISEVVEFDRESGEKGRVRNVHIADETGRIRLTLWDDEVEVVEGLREGDVVRVSGYSKSNQGRTEIRLGRYGSIQKIDEEIDIPNEMPQTERKWISEIREFDRAEVRAAIVQVFDINPIIYKCPECQKALKQSDGKYACPEHGDIEPEPMLMASFIIDDGTGNMRAVAFGRAAEKIIGMSAKEAVDVAKEKMDKYAPLRAIELGKEWVFRGSVRRNEIFDRLEFRVVSVSDVDVASEIERLIGELNGGV